MTTITVEELSTELFQSRTLLFKGSKEHFGQTPLELQRAVRLDRVRQLLLDPAHRSTSLGAIRSSTENNHRPPSPEAWKAQFESSA